GSDYSLDYEYLGPRQPNYRNDDDADSVASELSDASGHDGFDMWDEDPYSTNDYTWQSNDMRLTSAIKVRQREIDQINHHAPWKGSFWRKENGWPKQLSSSSSTTNHDQSANSLCLVLSEFGLTEKLHAVHRDKIIECGNTSASYPPSSSDTDSTTTLLETDPPLHTNTIPSNKYMDTHAAIAVPRTKAPVTSPPKNCGRDILSQFQPFNKYIKRSQFSTIYSKDAYLSLSFEPLSLAEKYGYMAIGGIEGEFELYCCMTQKPVKIWGTKFKGSNNVMLMTNAIQIVRWKKESGYDYLLIVCMNDAGVLVYELPKHEQCPRNVQLKYHIRAFDTVAINDARVNPKGDTLVCVGDDACIFKINITYHQNKLVFGAPKKLTIPSRILDTKLPFSTFSSQYITWSKSSLFFAHTSDTHHTVFVWRTQPKYEMLCQIDAGGYTYAIHFHPQLDGVLVFSNRYGYLHTVNLHEAVNTDTFDHASIPDFDRQTNKGGHVCTDWCSEGSEAVHHTHHLRARHEITMISFRGEKNRRLRILAKINGLQWSRDGRYLYVSTKKRVLAYEFMPEACRMRSLEEMAQKETLKIFE
ncbi:hypothetical protein K501DRAFT_135338, partial [Backusella circina FSU 941]